MVEKRSSEREHQLGRDVREVWPRSSLKPNVNGTEQGGESRKERGWRQIGNQIR